MSTQETYPLSSARYLHLVNWSDMYSVVPGLPSFFTRSWLKSTSPAESGAVNRSPLDHVVSGNADISFVAVETGVISAGCYQSWQVLSLIEHW
jgi:hypothetical protein